MELMYVLCPNGAGYIEPGFSSLHHDDCVPGTVVAPPLQIRKPEYQDIVMLDLTLGFLQFCSRHAAVAASSQPFRSPYWLA